MYIIRGKVIKIGECINTDIIAPGRWKSEGMETLKLHTMEAMYPDFYSLVTPGDILVAGRDFGCGSHREQAITVLQALGIQAVVADSVARLYFRNGLALGFPVLAASGICDMVKQRDQLEISIETCSINLKNCTSGQCMALPGLPSEMYNVLVAGGIFACLKQKIDTNHIFTKCLL